MGRGTQQKTKASRVRVPPVSSEAPDDALDASLFEAFSSLALGGDDDTGRAYATLGELWAMQSAQRDAFYKANDAWWAAGGYCGATDDCAMIGDDDGEAEALASAAFLDALLGRRPELRLSAVLDAGAGVGRVTKHVLLKRSGRVTLLEACPEWSRQSRRYLGKKRAASCEFLTGRIEEYVPRRGAFDLVWIQWVLQYLVDSDAVRALRQLASGLSAAGVLVLKENRPYLPGADPERFQMDTPAGDNVRYDVTRSDAHHRALFKLAGLEAVEVHRGDETNTWVLCRPTLGAAAEGSAGADGASPEAPPSGMTVFSQPTSEYGSAACGRPATSDSRAAGAARNLRCGQSATAGLMPPSDSESEQSDSGVEETAG